MSGLSDMGQRIAELYKEIVTTTVRFESLNRDTTKVVEEIRTAVQRCDERMQQMQLDHVRERAELGSQIKALDARLDALSENALHVVAREAARQAMHTLLADGQVPQPVLHIAGEMEPGNGARRLAAG
jgi:predicted  nucleic acid-binding Zn-ribbon protein